VSARRVLLAAAVAASLCAVNVDAAAAPMNIVAIGASNTAGWGVGSENAYPALLEAMLRAGGYDASVANAGVSFSTTAGMLRRLDSVVPADTTLVVLQPGGNDLRFFGSNEQRAKNIADIVGRMRARNIEVIVFENEIVPADCYQWDRIHFTAKGHDWVAAWLLPRVISSLAGRGAAVQPDTGPLGPHATK
jgi:acyl-CoA thioesterase I